MCAQVEVTKKEKKPIPLSTNFAVAHAVKDLDVDIVSVFPITPQTLAVEKIAEFIADGELDAEMIHTESEHSAASALWGAAVAGARAFTTTSSQGLALMHEVLHAISGARVPVVMGVAHRALSVPISIWNDQSDLFGGAERASWGIIFVSSAQEAYDTIIQAYRIAEDPRVVLPVMVCYDGFLLSHTFEPVVVEDREEVLKYAPKKKWGQKTWYVLDPDNPVSMGTLASPNLYYEYKYQQVLAMREMLKVIEEADKEFGKMFGRSYGIEKPYMLEDAEIALVANSAYAATLRGVVDKLRAEGMKVGLLEIRVYRPFPYELIKKLLANVEVVGVIDRAIDYGLQYEGPMFNAIASAYINDDERPKMVSFVAGIGQRTMLIEDFVNLYKKLDHIKKTGEVPKRTIFYGVRE